MQGKGIRVLGSMEINSLWRRTSAAAIAAAVTTTLAPFCGAKML